MTLLGHSRVQPEPVFTPATNRAVALLAIVAFSVRWAIATNSGFWRDEALFLAITRLPSWHQMIDFLRFHESHPPLFYILMRLWNGLLGNSDRSSVLLPVVVGAMLIPAMFLAGTILYSRRAGLIAAGLAALSPPLADHSAFVRPYSLLPLLALAGSCLLVLAMEKGGWRLWSSYAVTLAALVFTHNWSFLVVAGHAVSIAAWTATNPQHRRRIVRESTAAFAAAGIVYLPWIPALLFQFRNAGNAPLDVPGSFRLVRILGFTLWVLFRSTITGSADASGRAIIVCSLIVAVGLAMVGFIAKTRARRGANISHGVVPTSSSSRQRLATFVGLITVAVPILAALSLSWHSNLLVGRCVVMLAPLVLLQASHWVDGQWSRRVNEPGIVWIAGALGVLVIANYSTGLIRLIDAPRSNVRELAASLSEMTRSSDLVIVMPGWLASSFNYYYKMPVEQIDFPESGRLDTFDFARVWDRMAAAETFQSATIRIKRARRDGRRVWLVTDPGYLKPLSEREVEQAEKQREYYVMGLLRLSQIHRLLTQEFGSPRQTLRVSGSPPRYENITALLFGSEGSGTSTARGTHDDVLIHASLSPRTPEGLHSR